MKYENSTNVLIQIKRKKNEFYPLGNRRCVERKMMINSNEGIEVFNIFYRKNHLT